MSDVKSLLATATLPERSVAVCLQPDLTARMQDLQRELETEENARLASGSLASGGRSREIAEEQVRLTAEMRTHTVAFRLRALPRRQWTKLVAAHPKRDGDDRDAVAGLNVDTFFEAMVRACLVDPVLDEEDWDRLDDVLSDGQWEQLANAAWGVNRRDVDVPFSRLGSRILQNSVAEPNKLNGSVSASSVSTAGSPPKKRSTSTTKKPAA